jgi:hypothetical protein
MAPFTPFFTETLYQGLRLLHEDVNNPDATEDSVGKALSVHYLSIPEVNAMAWDRDMVASVNTLQVKVGDNICFHVMIGMCAHVRTHKHWWALFD